MDHLAAPTTTEQGRTLDDIIKEVERFRILVIGRSGVGKSSLINCVFGIDKALVADHKVGEADIGQEFISLQNDLFVLHDSKGFEPGDLDNFETVRNFVEERSKKPLLKDRIHGLWLCVETPTAGGRVFETGDEELLKFAHENKLPLVLVFTQYDRLVRTKAFQLRDTQPDLDPTSRRDQSIANAQEAFNTCLESLEVTMKHLGIPMPTYSKVSVRKGHEEDVSSLVQVTTDVAKERVKGDAWVLWSMAQRASLPVKIEACITKGIGYYLRALVGTFPGFGEWILSGCLEKVHKDIVTCWSFKGEVLNDPEFRGMMVHLVEDVRTENSAPNSPKVDVVDQLAVSASTSHVPTFGALGLAFLSVRWLQMTLEKNISEVQRLLIAYIVDLITILKGLFEKTIEDKKHEFTTNWPELQGVYESYEKSSSRQSIHESIRSKNPMLTTGDIDREIRRLLDVK